MISRRVGDLSGQPLAAQMRNLSSQKPVPAATRAKALYLQLEMGESNILTLAEVKPSVPPSRLVVSRTKTRPLPLAVSTHAPPLLSL
jgi:hypothetical protein